MMIVELSEFRLEDRGEQEGYIYALVEVTLHTSLQHAHQYVAERTLREGMPNTVEPLPGMVMPGTAWTTRKATEVETIIRAGRALADGPDPDAGMGFARPRDADEPIPPDDASLDED